MKRLNYISLYSILVGLLCFGPSVQAEWLESSHEVEVADVNGDSRIDLILRAQAFIRQAKVPYNIELEVTQFPEIGDVYLQSNNTEYQLYYPLQDEIAQNSSWTTSNYGLFYGDFNRDRLGDVFIKSNQTGWPSFLLLSGSEGNSPKIAQVIWPETLGLDLSQISDQEITIADVNGDGFADVSVESDQGQNILYGTETGELSHVQAGAPCVINTQSDSDCDGYSDGVDSAPYDSGIGEFNSELSPSSNAGSPTLLSEAELYSPSSLTGSLDGEFSVTSTGKATYRVPLVVPPGIQGNAPDLALAYNGQAGNSLLGRGWYVDGLSEISRCGTTYDQDDYLVGVNLKDNDRFCLNGSRLILVDGIYGQDGAVYRTEVESFSKVVSHGQLADGGPAYFTVWRKDGLIEEYGNSIDSRRLAYTKASAVTWGITSRQDRSGNAVDFSYVNDKSNGQFHISSISYGLNGKNRVSFVYEQRSDIQESYSNATYNLINRRLDKIELAQQSSLIKTYNLGYEYSDQTGHSRLIAIEECYKSSKCLPATSFKWLEQSGSSNLARNITHSDSSSYPAGSTYSNRSHLVGDFNADGRNDLLWTFRDGNRTGWTAFANDSDNGTFVEISSGQEDGYNASLSDDSSQKYLVGDVNGDGRDDLVWVARRGPDVIRSLYLANNSGSGFTAKGYQSDTDESFNQSSENRYQLADVNGDGRSDLVFTYQKDVRFGIAVYLAFEDTTGNVGFGRTSLVIDDAYTPEDYNNHDVALGDVNGDGKSDLLWTFTYQKAFYRVLYLANQDGAGFTKTSLQKDTTLFSSDAEHSDIRISLDDINGDRKSDLIYVYRDSNSLGRVLYLAGALGNTFERQGHTVDSSPGSGVASSHSNTSVQLSDLNGDGKKDLIYTYTNNASFGWVAYIANSAGNAFPTIREGVLNDASSNESDHQYFFADFTADGKGDLLWTYKDHGNTLHHVVLSTPTTYPDYIKSIVNGFGKEIHIDYDYLADDAAGIYRRSQVLPYPLREDIGLSYVVSGVQSSNGIGGFNELSFSYESAVTHLRGRGFLGFSKRITRDHSRNIIQTDAYRLKFPYTGLLLSSVMTSEGRALEKVFNHWDHAPLDHLQGQTVFRYLGDSAELKYELNDGANVAATVVKNTYDPAFGNLTESVRTLGVGFSGAIDSQFDHNGDFLPSQVSDQQLTVKTSYLYTNDASNWRLGFLTEKTETFSAPGEPTRTSVSKFTPYNGNSFLLGSEEHFSGSSVWQKTTYSARDSYGNPTTITQTAADISGTAESRVRSIGPYIDGIFPKKSINALGHQESYEYDPVTGQRTKVTDANGLESYRQFDVFGRLRLSINQNGSHTRVAYETCGSCPNLAKFKTVTRVTHPSENIEGAPRVTSYFDMFGRELQRDSLAYDGRLVRTTQGYDALGRKVSSTEPHFSGSAAPINSFSYDLFDRLRVESHASGGSLEHTYSSDEKFGKKKVTVETIVSKGSGNRTIRSTYRYNSLGQLRESIDGSNVLTSYRYDTQGNLKQTVVAGDASTTVTIATDVAGNKTLIDDPNAGTIEFKYDGFANLRRKTFSSMSPDHSITSHYDAIGRIVSRTDDDGDHTYTFNWSYDTAANGVGLPASVTGPDFERSFQYDAASRVWRTSTSLLGEATPKTVYQQYDGYGRPTAIQYPNGLRIKRDYGTYGYLKSIKDASGDTTLWYARAYDAFGQVELFDLGNGLTSYYDYDPSTGRITTIETGRGSDRSIQYLSYSFDSAGSLKKRTTRQSQQENINESFSYDTLHRLTSATTSGLEGGSRTLSYDYDSLGNIVTKSDVSDTNGYHYGENGAGPHAVTRLVHQGEITNYAYDKKGNMTQRGGTTLAYTVFNKPFKITDTGVSSEFQYGADRSRIYQNTVNNGVTTETFYYGSGYEVVNKGDRVKEKAYVDDIAVYSVTRDPATGNYGGWQYTHRDHLGSVEAITDENGTILERLVFAPFGQRRQGDWETASASFLASVPEKTFELTTQGFTGHEHLDETGLIHMNGRVYDPEIGRFLSPDTFVQLPQFSQSYNRYSYVLNNPLSYRDPSGDLIPLLVAVAVVSWQSYNAYDTVTSGAEDFMGTIDSSRDSTERVLSAVSLTSNFVGVPKFAREGAGWAFRKLTGRNKTPDTPDANVNTQQPEAFGSDTNSARKSETKDKPCGCFPAGTVVWTKDGLKPIESVEVGDLLLAKSDVTHDIDWKAVEKIYRYDQRRLYEITTQDHDGTLRHLVVTDDHPFFIDGRGWVETRDILLGEAVQTIDEELVNVVEIRDLGTRSKTYNFEIADYHSYFVTDQGLWVHNGGPCDQDREVVSEANEADVTKKADDFVYRGGSGTPTNLTPRLKDTGGLSGNVNPMPGKNQVIDTSKLDQLCAVCDNPKTGHVSIKPKDMSQMQSWIDSRGSGTTHPLTQELMNAVVDQVKR